jgi:hypothetical protein
MYFLADLNQVKGENNMAPFESVMSAVEQAAFDRAKDIWPGFEPGGMMPGAKQFGVGPLRKNDMSADTSDSAPSGSYSFDHAVSSTGWADLFNFTVRDNTIIALAGFAFQDPTLNVSQLRVEVGDRSFPIWDLNIARSFANFALILKEDAGAELIAAARERVLVRGYWESTGNQRVTPIGLHLYRNLNAVLTET